MTARTVRQEAVNYFIVEHGLSAKGAEDFAEMLLWMNDLDTPIKPWAGLLAILHTECDLILWCHQK